MNPAALRDPQPVSPPASGAAGSPGSADDGGSAMPAAATGQAGGRETGGRRRRWVFFILTVWGLPAFLLWWGLGRLAGVVLERQAQAESDRLEHEVEALGLRSDPRVFFQRHLARVWSSLEGMAARREALEKVVRGFRREWPAGLFDLYLFDGEGGLLPVGDPPPEMQLFHDLTRAPWTVPLELAPRQASQLSRVLPSPQSMVKILKGRPGRVLALGGSGRFAWGFYDQKAGIPGQRVGGLLAFIHPEAMPRDLVLRRVLAETRSSDLGFLLEGEAGVLPASLGGVSPGVVEARFHQEPVGRFELDGRLVVVRRQDMATLLVGGVAAPALGPVLPLLIGAAFLLGSLWLLVRSYQNQVLGRPVPVGLRTKLIGYFSLSFALPLVAVGFLTWAFLADRRDGALEASRRESFRRLVEVDRGFEEFVARKRLTYQALARRLAGWVATPSCLVAEAEAGFADLRWDNLHLVASTGGLLVSQESTPAEMRRNFRKPYRQRLPIFHSWIDRGAAPPARDILNMILEHPRDLGPLPDTESFQGVLRKAAAQAGQIAIHQFNRLHGVAVTGPAKASQLVMETMIESESFGLLDAARHGMGTFVPIEGNREMGLIYVDVLPGPAGEGWFALFVFNNIVNFEREYLEGLFGTGPALPAAGSGEPGGGPPAGREGDVARRAPGRPGAPADSGPVGTGSVTPCGAGRQEEPVATGSWEPEGVGAPEGPGEPSGNREAVGPDGKRFRTVTSPVGWLTGEGWDFRAISLHQSAPNFPTTWEFRKFRDLFAVMEASPRPLARTMVVDGVRSDVCALNSSFLKHYLLVAVTGLEELEEQQDRFEWMVWGVFAGLGAFGLALSWLLIRRFLVPVRDLTRGLAAMKAKEFDWRLPVRSDDELGRLCGAFNEALAKLRDLEIARAVQADLLPQQSQRFGAYEVIGVNIMTQQVGGDYFDFIPLPHGLVAVAMGDVSGHGVSAALVTAMAKAAFSILCPRQPDRPEEVLQEVNRELLAQVKRAKMMTCFLGILDPQSDCIICANAGQSYPLLIGGDGKAQMVRLPSQPLGVRAKMACHREVVSLRGKTMMLYSDGLVEAVNDRQEMFGYEALARAAEVAVASRHPDLAGRVLEQVREFTGEVPWNDDATLVVIRPVIKG
ncbi:MAG: SpoIIE family protein phosphatase [Candidatus Riflebacteria bacterium]|nr:SpoIIE family protein phosphatase [Candidatus Riflebacteria bacterium]